MNVPSWHTYRATTMRSKELNRLTLPRIFKKHKLPICIRTIRIRIRISIIVTMWLNRSIHTAQTQSNQLSSDRTIHANKSFMRHIQEKSFKSIKIHSKPTVLPYWLHPSTILCAAILHFLCWFYLCCKSLKTSFALINFFLPFSMIFLIFFSIWFD